MEIPTLYIDNKEKSYVVDAIFEYPEYFPKVEIVQLGVDDDETGEFIETADFSNDRYSFAAERKVIHTQKKDKNGMLKEGDFHTSLIKHRLKDQLAKLRLYWAGNRHLLCEGYLLNYAVRHPGSMELAYSMVGYCGVMGISFQECYDLEDLIYRLYWINRLSGAEPLKRSDIQDEAKYINYQIVAMSKIPSVGPKRAKIIFQKYSTIANILENIDKLHKIKYIGESTQDAIRDFFFEDVLIE